MVFLLVAFFCQCLTLRSHGSPLLGVRGKDSAGLRLPSKWYLGNLETARHWSGEGGVRRSETVGEDQTHRTTMGVILLV